MFYIPVRYSTSHCGRWWVPQKAGSAHYVMQSITSLWISLAGDVFRLQAANLPTVRLRFIRPFLSLGPAVTENRSTFTQQSVKSIANSWHLTAVALAFPHNRLRYVYLQISLLNQMVEHWGRRVNFSSEKGDGES